LVFWVHVLFLLCCSNFQILRDDTRPFWRVLATINLSLCWKKRNPEDTSFGGSGVYVDSLSFNVCKKNNKTVFAVLTSLPFGVGWAMCQLSERTPFMGYVRAEDYLGRVPDVFLLLFVKRRSCCLLKGVLAHLAQLGSASVIHFWDS
jgi:hypothetical protein